MIRIAKFSIPVSMIEEFNEVINIKKLKGTIISTKDGMCLIEVIYTKSQTAFIDEVEESMAVFTALALVCVSTLSAMVSKAQESKSKK